MFYNSTLYDKHIRTESSVLRLGFCSCTVVVFANDSCFEGLRYASQPANFMNPTLHMICELERLDRS